MDYQPYQKDLKNFIEDNQEFWFSIPSSKRNKIEAFMDDQLESAYHMGISHGLQNALEAVRGEMS